MNTYLITCIAYGEHHTREVRASSAVAAERGFRQQHGGWEIISIQNLTLRPTPEAQYVMRACKPGSECLIGAIDRSEILDTIDRAIAQGYDTFKLARLPINWPLTIDLGTTG